MFSSLVQLTDKISPSVEHMAGGVLEHHCNDGNINAGEPVICFPTRIFIITNRVLSIS